MAPTIVNRSTVIYEGGPGRYAEKLTADLGQLYNIDALSDVTFHCSDGNVLKTNRLLLVNVSKVFEDIFRNDCNWSTFVSTNYDFYFPGSEMLIFSIV